MDHLDAMIIRELTFRPTDAHQHARGVRRTWDAARALGIHPSTVKRRLGAMRDSGLLRGVVLQPAPALVGRRVAEVRLDYDDAASKRRALPALREEPSLWCYHGFVGRSIAVTIAATAGLDPLDVAGAIGKETSARRVALHHSEAWPIEADRVSPSDLRLLAAFSDDALRPARDVAREIGVPARIVATRMRALARLRAFETHVALNYERAAPGLAVLLDAHIEPGRSGVVHAELMRRFPLAFCRSSPGAENAAVVLFVEGAAELEDHLSRAESVPHVRDVQPRILREAFHEPARWQDALLAASPVAR